MSRILALAGMLLIAGCDPIPELAIRADEWVCSKIARIDAVMPLVAGKSVIPQTNSRMECVQWTRMGEQP